MKKVCASNKGGRKPAPWNDNYRGYKIRSVYGSSNIEEDIDKKIADYLYDRLLNKFEDNLVLQVGSDISEYDPTWALSDYNPNRRAERQLDAARAAYIEALVDAITWCRE